MLKADFFVYEKTFNVVDRISLDFVTKENGCGRLEYKLYSN